MNFTDKHMWVAAWLGGIVALVIFALVYSTYAPPRAAQCADDEVALAHTEGASYEPDSYNVHCRPFDSLPFYADSNGRLVRIGDLIACDNGAFFVTRQQQKEC